MLSVSNILSLNILIEAIPSSINASIVDPIKVKKENAHAGVPAKPYFFCFFPMGIRIKGFLNIFGTVIYKIKSNSDLN